MLLVHLRLLSKPWWMLLFYLILSQSLATDASDVSTGAVLQQWVESSWQPLAFFSRKLQPAERNYSTFSCWESTGPSSTSDILLKVVSSMYLLITSPSLSSLRVSLIVTLLDKSDISTTYYNLHLISVIFEVLTMLWLMHSHGFILSLLICCLP